MSADTPVVIVGTGLAGTRCATTLRRLLPDQEVLLVGDEPHAPYERPPLSKELLARTRGADELTLAGAQARELEQQGIVLATCRTVTSIAAGSVTLDGAELVPASAVVLATGARPRSLPTTAPAGRVHVLRSLTDAMRLRAALEAGQRLVIIGSGFIGAEVASTARARGVEVTIIEAESAPFTRTLGAQVGTWLTQRWASAGVRLHVDARVASIGTAPCGGAVVELADGTEIEADHVLVAIGTEPRDELFHAAFPGRGVAGRGVPTDGAGRTPVPGVWAAGDVALVDPGSGVAARRIEHWTDAAAAAIRVARGIAGMAAAAPTAPYAWSDQFDVRVQVVGHPGGELDGAIDVLDGDRLLVRYLDELGQLRGVVAVGHPADVARYRRELAA